MGYLDILKKDMEVFPPQTSRWSILYLQYSEFMNSLLVYIIFINYIFFCGQSYELHIVRENNFTFRLINISISVLIVADIVCKVQLIRPLYFNSFYYGQLFIMFDLMSGPLSLMLSLFHEDSSGEITYADILILFRVFCMEKIRLLIKDVLYILYVARYIVLSIFLTFYVHSYFAYRMFQGVAPKQFGNVYVSMLSMFQVVTLDSWNEKINQPVSKAYGQQWSLFFIYFIIFMFYYFINLLLGAFVSYYSSPNLRVNFEYHYDHDEILNPDLVDVRKRTYKISEAIKILQLDQQQQYSGLGKHQYVIFMYAVVQMLLEILQITHNTQQVKVVYFATEKLFGLYFLYVFITKLREYKISHDHINVRRYVLALLWMGGPLAQGIDIITLVNSYYLDLQYGPGVRVLVIMAVDCIQEAVFRFIELLPGVSHILLFIGGVLFTFCLIGQVYLEPMNALIGQPIFESMTSTYLFLLQTITFDSWADVARIIIRHEGFLFVVYFTLITVFIGFFLMNMLVGITATMIQPSNQNLFYKEHTLRQRVPRSAVIQMQDQMDTPDDQILKNILNQFNDSKDPEERMYVEVEDQTYEISTKNFIILDDES